MKYAIAISVFCTFFPVFMDVEFIQTHETDTEIQGVTIISLYGVVVNVSEVVRPKKTTKKQSNTAAVLLPEKKQTKQKPKEKKQKQDVGQNRRLRNALEWMDERGKLTTSSIKLEL